MSKKVPDIRFEKFNDEWKPKLLSKLMDFSNGINAPKENYGQGRKMISVMDVLDEFHLKYKNIRSSVLVTPNIEENNKVEAGDLVFVRSSETQDEVGWAKAYLESEYALFSGFTIRGKKKSEFDSRFVELSLNYKNREQIEKNAGGSTRFNVNQNILKNVEILGASLEEQYEIGQFFSRIDDLITVQKELVEKIKQTKQSMLQKMFPQEGEFVPKIRFTGFEGEWHKKTLNDIATIIGGGTPSTSRPAYWNGDINWYSPVEIGNSIYVNESVKKITPLGLKNCNAKMLPANKTILFTSRAGIGNMAILKSEAATNQGFQSLVIKDNFDVYFVYSMGSEIKKYALKKASGSTFLEISGKVLGEMKVLHPSLQEQQLIGAFFKQLDENIVANQEKLNKLNIMKQALLQKMLV